MSLSTACRAGRALTGAALIVGLVAAAGCAPAIDSTMQDAQASVAVRSALLNEADAELHLVDVQVSGGVATLTGQVATQADAERAVAIAAGVTGVEDVRSELEIGGPLGERLPPVAAPGVSLSAIPEPVEPPRFLGAGAAVTYVNLTEEGLGDGAAVGPIVRLGVDQGWGPTVRFSWYRTDLAGPGQATLRVRPIMGGVAYGLRGSATNLSLQLAAGYSFNSLDPDLERAGPGRALAVSNSFVWQPGASLWWDVLPRVGLNFFGGYIFTRPEVTFVSDTAIETRRISANSVVLSVGVAYWIF